MMHYLFVFLLTFFAISNCSQAQNNSASLAQFEKKHGVLANGTPNILSQEGLQINYIIFGVYCGECTGHCATMFMYNCHEKANAFFIDDSDSYFKNNGKIIFKKHINTHENFAVAQSVIDRIPKQLLKAGPWKGFGCPDCTDGCGIYFEVGQEQGIKRFYIDCQTQQLTGEIKEFAEFIKTAVAKLNEQNRIKR
jgi:hypothetical protein